MEGPVHCKTPRVRTPLCRMSPGLLRRGRGGQPSGKATVQHEFATVALAAFSDTACTFIFAFYSAFSPFSPSSLYRADLLHSIYLVLFKETFGTIIWLVSSNSLSGARSTWNSFDYRAIFKGTTL